MAIIIIIVVIATTVIISVIGINLNRRDGIGKKIVIKIIIITLTKIVV